MLHINIANVAPLWSRIVATVIRYECYICNFILMTLAGFPQNIIAQKSLLNATEHLSKS